MSNGNDSQISARPNAGSAPDTDLLLKYLELHDAACPVCKYNLHLLRENRCPECGTRFHLAVGTSEPSVLPWTLIILALGLPLGLGVVAAVELVLNGLPMNESPSLVDVFAYVIAALVLTVGLLVMRKRFWSLRRNVQRNLVILAFLADALWFFYLVTVNQ